MTTQKIITVHHFIIIPPAKYNQKRLFSTKTIKSGCFSKKQSKLVVCFKNNL